MIAWSRPVAKPLVSVSPTLFILVILAPVGELVFSASVFCVLGGSACWKGRPVRCLSLRQHERNLQQLSKVLET